MSLSNDAAGRLVGVSGRTVRKWRAAGKLRDATLPDGSLDPERFRHVFAHERTKPTPPRDKRRQPRALRSVQPAAGPLDVLQRQKLDVWIRSRELELRVRTGDLIERTTAKRTVLEFGEAVVNALTGFPARVVGQLAATYNLDQRLLL